LLAVVLAVMSHLVALEVEVLVVFLQVQDTQ
jgi:hypothetical protein